MVKKTAFLTLLITAIIIGCSDKNNSSNNKFYSITPVEAFNMIKDGNTILLDIRTPGEIMRGTINGAVFLPVNSIINGSYNLPKDKNIILFCAVGGRSLKASKAMAGNGYSRIYNMKGGISAWQRSNLPVKR